MVKKIIFGIIYVIVLAAVGLFIFHTLTDNKAGAVTITPTPTPTPYVYATMAPKTPTEMVFQTLAPVENATENETKPTATPKPTVTPVPTPTLVPTETPIPTESPAPTETPIPTETPVPTATPATTATPKPTMTPKPTAAPEPTRVPTPSITPKPSATPGAQGETDAPVPTIAPTATPRPSTSPAPTPTPASDVYIETSGSMYVLNDNLGSSVTRSVKVTMSDEETHIYSQCCRNGITDEIMQEFLTINSREDSLLRVGAVWVKDGNTHIVVANFTGRERQMTVYTDKKKYVFSLTDTADLFVDTVTDEYISAERFAVVATEKRNYGVFEIVIPDISSFVLCYDTTLQGYAGQLMFVNATDKDVWLSRRLATELFGGE